MRVSKATAVIVHRIPAGKVDWFLDWQRGVAAAVEAFPGYRGTEVYPPPGGREGEWVVLVNFGDEASLKAWVDSPVRGQWVDRLTAAIGGFDLQVPPGGFGAWFSRCMQGKGEAPPAWKMALVVLLGLYPTVMCLSLFPGPILSPLGLAVSMLVGNALSVAILQWGVMPVLNVLSAPWMAANAPEKKTFSRIGVGVILTILASLAAFFHSVTG
jgi:antibiotic biosynthesis monooxygenase (ABM) superfamily enzyme